MQHRDPSSDDQQIIQPAEFTFGGERKQGRQSAQTASVYPQTTHRRTLINTTIAGGTVLALVAVFWGLPQLVEPPKISTPNTAAPSVKNSAVASKSPIKESPYSDAEIAQQRRQVQKVLQEIFQLQEELLERKVETWAAEEYFAARTLAEEADGVYRQRKFMQALQQYRQALAAIQQIRDGIPQRLERHLAEGNSALDTGQALAANTAFDLVLMISENHPRGITGKARAELLPQAWEKYSAGSEAFTGNDLNSARDSLKAALEIDPETRPAKELLPKVELAITERDYSQAMSEGYSALSGNDFNAAKQAFLRAQKLKPGSSDPATGLTQAENGLEQNRVNQLFARAAQQERQEQWHKANKNYKKLIEADSSLVHAITGAARTDARAKLDDQLQDLLKDPLTLSQGQRNRYARKVLADARAIQTGTPRIKGQIEQLETALTQALIPIAVVLQSDSSTSVTIYHVGQLGNFAERQITLKPGRYTAVGTRHGYRDVRQEFTVDPSNGSPTVTIQCAEKINSANNG